MKFWFAVLCLAITVIAIVLAVVTFGIPIDDPEVFNIFTAVTILFLAPIVIAVISVGILSMHPRSFNMHSSFTQRESSEMNDPLLHTAVGLLEAYIQDVTHGRLIVPEVYEATMRTMLESTFSYMEVYTDRGYTIHYAFHHDDAYNAHVAQQLSDRDVVIEIDGLFDFYYERDGQRHQSPHAFDQTDPLLRQSGSVRLRLVRPQRNDTWQLAGISDPISRLEMGLATH